VTPRPLCALRSRHIECDLLILFPASAIAQSLTRTTCHVWRLDLRATARLGAEWGYAVVWRTALKESVGRS